MKKLFFLFMFLQISSLLISVSKNECEDWILNALKTQNDSIKIYILTNIEEIASKKFYPEIKKLTYSQNDNVKLRSLYVLYKVYKDTTAVNQISNFLLQKPSITEDATPLQKAKFYLKNQLRAESAKMLGELGDEKVVEVLSKTVNDEDGNVKDASYFALALLSQRGKIKPLPEIKEFFYEGLKDLNPKVRLQAVKFLGELKYKDSIQPLTLRLKDPNKEVVAETIKSLGKIGDDSVIQDLIQFKTHPDETLRLTLAETLGLFENKETLITVKNVLNDMLQDINGMVRVASARSLLKLKDRTGVEILKKGLQSSDSDVVIYCIETFGKYGSLEDVGLIEKFIEQEDINIKTIAYVNILKIYNRIEKKEK